MTTDTPPENKTPRRQWRSAFFQGVTLLVFVAALYAYQTRNLLDTGRTSAPTLRLPTLSGQTFDLESRRGKTALVYFFAPWCRVCGASAHNLRRLQRETNINVALVALDWSDRAQVQRYVKEHDLDASGVLLGSRHTGTNWRVPGFPTYYVIDSEGRVARRDFGYSTAFGLWWRTRFVY